MMLKMRHGTVPKLICFAMFISMGCVPALLGWLEWEEWGRGEWKQIDIGYGVEMGQENRCMTLGARESNQVRRSQLLWHSGVKVTALKQSRMHCYCANRRILFLYKQLWSNSKKKDVLPLTEQTVIYGHFGVWIKEARKWSNAVSLWTSSQDVNECLCFSIRADYCSLAKICIMTVDTWDRPQLLCFWSWSKKNRVPNISIKIIHHFWIQDGKS